MARNAPDEPGTTLALKAVRGHASRRPSPRRLGPGQGCCWLRVACFLLSSQMPVLAQAVLGTEEEGLSGAASQKLDFQGTRRMQPPQLIPSIHCLHPGGRHTLILAVCPGGCQQGNGVGRRGELCLYLASVSLCAKWASQKPQAAFPRWYLGQRRGSGAGACGGGG